LLAWLAPQKSYLFQLLHQPLLLRLPNQGVLIPLLQPLVRMMRMLLSMLQLLVVRMIVQVLLVMVQGVFLVVFVLVVECVLASVL
jgi:hypothetical protein